MLRKNLTLESEQEHVVLTEDHGQSRCFQQVLKN